jgi:hypothetical protein
MWVRCGSAGGPGNFPNLSHLGNRLEPRYYLGGHSSAVFHLDAPRLGHLPTSGHVQPAPAACVRAAGPHYRPPSSSASRRHRPFPPRQRRLLRRVATRILRSAGVEDEGVAWPGGVSRFPTRASSRTTLVPLPHTCSTRWPCSSPRSAMSALMASKIRKPSSPSMATSAKPHGFGDSRAAVSSASNRR